MNKNAALQGIGRKREPLGRCDAAFLFLLLLAGCSSPVEELTNRCLAYGKSADFIIDKNGTVREFHCQ